MRYSWRGVVRETVHRRIAVIETPYISHTCSGVAKPLLIVLSMQSICASENFRLDAARFIRAFRDFKRQGVGYFPVQVPQQILYETVIVRRSGSSKS